MAWVFIVLSIALLIIAHELGHLLAAKAVGIRATKFSVGFGPSLGKTWRGVRYQVALLPLGGYVRICGMLRPDAEDVRAIEGVFTQLELEGPFPQLRTAVEQSDYARALVYIQECEERLSDCPAAARRQSRLLARGRGLLENFREALEPGAYWSSAAWRKIVTVAAGVVVNLALALLLLGFGFTQEGAQRVLPDTEIAQIAADSPAAKAGLQVFDRVISVDGTIITRGEELSDSINATGGRPFMMVVLRGDEEIDIGPLEAALVEGRWRIGISPVVSLNTTEPLGPAEAAREALDTTRDATTSTIDTLGGVPTSEEKRGQLTSIVGIADTMNQSFDRGTFIQVVGMLSLALAIFNILPILPLDGGYIAITLVEAVSRRRVPRRVIRIGAMVGLALLLTLFAIGLRNDITWLMR